MASPRGPLRDGRRIDLYVQATADIGMGHLSRASALAGQLEGLGFTCRIAVDADEHGRGFARSHDVFVGDELRGEPGVVVIDAVDVPAATAQTLSTFTTRILISPSFRRADLATHVLVRDLPRRLMESLASTAHVEVDPRFAFATAHGADRLAVDFTEIRVGVCLTAGRGSTARPILACLLDGAGITQITAIGNIDLPVATSHRTSLRRVGFTDDPWHFLQDSNVFVGGDGVMVSEAVARALPTFSVTTRTRLEKNRALIDARAIEPVLWQELDCRRLQQQIVDRDRLQQLHVAARACYQPSDSQALAKAIERICDGRE